MKPKDSPHPKLPSLADYMVRYDLAGLLEEARMDYAQSSTGTPRLLNQKDIAARFRKRAPSATPAKPPRST